MRDEDGLNASKWRQIEETVLQILKTSELETATEFAVRSAAGERLDFDLSCFPYRQLVHQLVDSFLLSAAISILDTTPSHQKYGDTRDNNDGNAVNCEKQKRKLSGGADDSQHNYIGKVICKLSENKRVTVYDSSGTNNVAIGNFHTKDGIMHPTLGPNMGICLTAAEWSSLKNSFPSVEKACAEMESRGRSETFAKQSDANTENLSVASADVNGQVEPCSSGLRRIIYPPLKRKRAEADASGSVTVSNSQEHIFADRIQEAGTSGLIATSNSQEKIPAERKQTEHGISTSPPALPIPRPWHYKENVTPVERLIPIQTPRLDGKNYLSWRHYMQLFLKQLNLAYVLTEPCPGISLNQEARHDEKCRGEEAIQRWVDDDYICRDHILKSLCDNLFQWHSQKICSARDLWEELRLAYNEDFGTKRSLINKYIHFQMVDGVSVLEQVQGLHKMADSIMASGTWIDENFHVSVIVSKLPPSWKEFRVTLMHEEVLPVSTLMLRLQVEEESRRWHKKEINYKNSHTMDPKFDHKEINYKNSRTMDRTKDQKFDHRFPMRRKENKRVCYMCGKDGHIIKNCPYRKFEVGEKSNKKENGVPHADTNMVEKHAGINVGQMTNGD